MKHARRSHALRRRYGHGAGKGARVTSGLVHVDVRYERDRDAYRGDVSWPEMSTAEWERAYRREAVHPSGAIRHHKIVVIPAGPVLVRFTDVTRPNSRAKLEAAASLMIKHAAVEDIAAWHPSGLLKVGPS
jgi:hypothetical protein